MRDASRPKSSGGHSLRRLRGLETATTLVGPPGSRRSGGAVPAEKIEDDKLAEARRALGYMVS